MTRSRHAIALVIGFLTLFFVGAAQAQEDLSAGKTPEELFKLDCAICHKSPQGLSKAGGLFGLDSFLAQHYTASTQSAAAIAGYLKSVDRSARQATPHRRTRPHRTAEPHKPAGKSDKAKSEAKSGAKPEQKKVDKPKTDASAKATDEKPSKADKPKMADPKPAEKKPAAAETKSEAKREKPKAEKKKSD
jgi:hypothetical protein